MASVQDQSMAQAPIGVALTPWWLVLLEGIAGLILGILLLTDTARTLFTLVLFLGIYWFVGGVFDLIMMFVDRRQWGWKLFSGLLGIVAGLVVIRDPLWAAAIIPATLIWLLAAAGVVIGVISIVRAFTGGGWGMGLLGVLSIVIGIFLFAHTLFTAVVLIYAVAIIAIIGGIVAIIGSFMLRGDRRRAESAAGQAAPYQP
jgi:uncharacterized membrane protein HdeD (DUF308 family)